MCSEPNLCIYMQSMIVLWVDVNSSFILLFSSTEVQRKIKSMTQLPAVFSVLSSHECQGYFDLDVSGNGSYLFRFCSKNCRANSSVFIRQSLSSSRCSSLPSRSPCLVKEHILSTILPKKQFYWLRTKE